jgi:uncharacterized membrane protein
MQKNLFKPFVFTLLSILFFAHPLSISAAVFQKQMTQKSTAIFEKKVKIKQTFFQRYIQKRIEKVLKKQTEHNFEQEQTNQTIGIIALLLLFVGFVLLLASVGIGALLVFIALLLSIIGLITEENPIYARRTFWISLVLTIYILARIRNVI